MSKLQLIFDAKKKRPSLLLVATTEFKISKKLKKSFFLTYSKIKFYNSIKKTNK